MNTQEIAISGLDCADCARTVERGIEQLAGVSSCSINLAAARLSVSFDPQRVSQQAIIGRIQALGYGAAASEATDRQNTPAYAGAGDTWQRRLHLPVSLVLGAL